MPAENSFQEAEKAVKEVRSLSIKLAVDYKIMVLEAKSKKRLLD